NPEKAIYNRTSYESWLNFGGGDLILNGRSGSCSKCNYEKVILDKKKIFIAEQVEIFKVQISTESVKKKSQVMEIERKSKRAKLSR
ncbi:20831_t:CDS:2, partial [Cetraspora pellucida]